MSKFPQPRQSACAEASSEYELSRLRRLSVEERIKIALSMEKRFSWMKVKVEKKKREPTPN